MDIHYDPRVWDSTGSIEFNVELGYDNIDYTSQRLAKSSTTSDTNSDSTAVSWLSGLVSSLRSKPMASSTAIAHGFIDDDCERRFSYQSFQILHSTDIPSLSSRNCVHLSTPSLRYTKQYYPELEPESADVDLSHNSTKKKKNRLYKIKLLPSSPFLEKVRSKLKSQWKKQRTRSFYKITEDGGPMDDVVLYPDEPDPDPFAKQFGPYRLSID